VPAAARAAWSRDFAGAASAAVPAPEAPCRTPGAAVPSGFKSRGRSRVVTARLITVTSRQRPGVSTLFRASLGPSEIQANMPKDDKKHKDSKKDRKIHETREEKMLRRLEKKKRKREAEQERKTICGYTDENNRFGDSSLTQQFKWHKKDEVMNTSTEEM
jgi:hypothetical protein